MKPSSTLSIAQRAATGAGWIIAWRVATRNIGLLSTLILVRLLQPTDFGLVALATGFIGSVDALSAIGVQDALVRSAKVDRDLYNTGFTLAVARGALTATIIAAIAAPVATFFGDSRLQVVMLALSAGTLISAFENIGIVDFQRDLAFRKEFTMQLWSRVLGCSVTIGTAALWHSYWALIAGILAYRLVRLLMSYLMSPYRPHLAILAWRQLIGFSLWTWAQTMLYQARERLDGILIGRMSGTAEVGMFSIGYELGSLPTTELVEPLCRALFAGFASLHNASKSLSNLFLGAIGLGSLLILPAGVGISMVADPMVRLCLGEHWLSVVPVVQIIAISGITAIFTQSCANLLNAVGRPHMTLYAGLASTPIKLAGLLILVPIYGLTGAAVAQLLSVCADLVLLLWVTLPAIAVSMKQVIAATIRPIIASAVMAVVLWQLDMAWTPSHGQDVGEFIEDAALRSVIGAIVYMTVLTTIWFAAGLPDGPERYSLSIIAGLYRRTRLMILPRSRVLQ